MKAYKCDICGAYVDSLPLGVIFDNENGFRRDLCPDCLDDVREALEKMKDEPRDIKKA